MVDVVKGKSQRASSSEADICLRLKYGRLCACGSGVEIIDRPTGKIIGDVIGHHTHVPTARLRQGRRGVFKGDNIRSGNRHAPEQQ